MTDLTGAVSVISIYDLTQNAEASRHAGMNAFCYGIYQAFFFFTMNDPLDKPPSPSWIGGDLQRSMS